MKPKNLNKKLGLKKETVVNLSEKELSVVFGGKSQHDVFCATIVEGCDTSTCHESGILYSCDCDSLPGTLYPFQGC